MPPPRDHLRMETDGRLVNRAPAPQVPDRKTSIVHQQQNSHSSQIAQIVEPTPDQVENIKKYQVSYQLFSFFLFIYLFENDCLKVAGNYDKRLFFY